MLKLRNSISFILTVSLGAAGTANATPPPNNVDSDGMGNTAMGTGAMGVTTSGSNNTAAGANALDSDNAGSSNTAVGASAMVANNDGDSNTAVGFESLLLNNADSNTAVGYETLLNNTTGHQNGAFGFKALFSNTTGSNNIAIGPNALLSNTTGGTNVALGVATLQVLTTGQNNLAIGANSLHNNKSGSSNTAIGASAGFNITGKSNIDIGNEGTAGENGVIRIGTNPTQTAAYLAGVYTSPLSGALSVVVSSSGRLGVVASSERFKTDIASMDAESAKLAALRPVTFHLKSDPTSTLQYGLIAEEVAKIYPELVVRDHNGRIDGLRYDELAPLLLKEVQLEHQRASGLRDELKRQTAQIAELKQQMAELTAAVTQVRTAAFASR